MVTTEIKEVTTEYDEKGRIVKQTEKTTSIIDDKIVSSQSKESKESREEEAMRKRCNERYGGRILDEGFYSISFRNKGS